MKAVCWHGRQDMRVDTVDDPKIEDSRDAIIRITATAICGSDLHLYNGFMPTMEAGDVIGHEPMGEVVETAGALLKGRSTAYAEADDGIITQSISSQRQSRARSRSGDPLEYLFDDFN